jgi:flagellar biosynthesis protein FliR
MSQLVADALVVGARALPIALLVPLGHDLVSINMRLTLACVLTMAAFPSVQSSEVTCLILLQQLALGLLLSLPFILVVTLFEMTGELFDVGRGQMMANLIDPFHDQTAPLAKLAHIGVGAFLIWQGALLELVIHFVSSFAQYPPGTHIELTQLGGLLLRLVLYVLSLLALFSLPLLFMFLLVELAAALAGRVVPGAKLSGESFLLKSIALTLTLLIALTTGALETLGELFRNLIAF